MTQSNYSDQNIKRALLTLTSIERTVNQIEEWNSNINSASDYYNSSGGMQLLAANCMLITAIGEGINKILRLLPDFLESTYPEVPWKAIVGMRNHIAHGYFEIDADIIYEATASDIPLLGKTIREVIQLLSRI